MKVNGATDFFNLEARGLGCTSSQSIIACRLFLRVMGRGVYNLRRGIFYQMKKGAPVSLANKIQQLRIGVPAGGGDLSRAPAILHVI